MERNDQDKDRLFSHPESGEKPFAFDNKVSNVFDDMVSRSVPLYAELQIVTGYLAAKALRESRYQQVYDVGSSTGNSLLSINSAAAELERKITGIEPSPSMVSASLEKIRAHESIEVIEGDIREVALQPAAFISMNYTLQFIPPKYRQKILSKVSQAIDPEGGIFLFSEKMASESEDADTLMDELYYFHKRRQGYSTTEIAEKRKALDGVLVRQSEAEYREMLASAGFSSVIRIMQGYHFTTLLASK